MTKEQSIKRLLYSEFDKLIEGADIYDHRGSKWIIFTNEKRWVVEFTKEKTLWFNYHRFNEVLVLFAMDCNDDRNYIKEWYEKRFIFNQKVIYTEYQRMDPDLGIEDTIQNGVRSTKLGYNRAGRIVENTIQNGVRSTSMTTFMVVSRIEDTIQNGVKEVKISPTFTENSDWLDGDEKIHNIIQNGVKNIRKSNSPKLYSIDDVTKNGVKDIGWKRLKNIVTIQDTIQNGVKETLSNVHPYPKEVRDAIENGVKHTQSFDGGCYSLVEDAIQNGIKT